MAVECSIDRDTADFRIEVYYWDYVLMDNVVTRKDKVLLAYVPMFFNYELERDDQEYAMMKLRTQMIELYRDWPDGEVIVELVIKEEFVNQ